MEQSGQVFGGKDADHWRRRVGVVGSGACACIVKHAFLIMCGDCPMCYI